MRRLLSPQILLCLIFLAVGFSMARAESSNQVLVVFGRLITDNPQLIAGSQIRLENQSQNIKQEGSIDNDGSYSIILVSLDGQPVAVTEDQLLLSVIDNRQKVLSQQTYRLSEQEVQTAKLRLDLPFRPLVEPASIKGESGLIFTLAGRLTDADGRRIIQPFPLTVTNQTKSIEQKTGIGQNTELGSYLVSFVSLNQSPIVSPGDQLLIQVSTGEGQETESYQVTAEDVKNAGAAVDLQLKASYPDQVPTNSVFVLTGQVTDANGLPVLGRLEVVVTHPSRSLIVKTKTGKGSDKGTFVAPFVALDGKPLVTVGDELQVKVSTLDGSINSQKTIQLTAEEVIRAGAKTRIVLEDLVLGIPTEIEFVAQPSATMIAGTNFQFEVIGQDVTAQPVEVNPLHLTWSVSNQIGELNQPGQFTATKVGTGFVEAQLISQPQIVVVSDQIQVVASSASQLKIILPTDSITIGGENKLNFTIQVTDDFGNGVEDEVVELTATQGEVSQTATQVGDGIYSAQYLGTKTVGQSIITATLSNGAVDQVTINQVKTSFSLSALETEQDLAIGDKTNFILLLKAEPGFLQAVSLTASSLPAGLSANFNPIAIDFSQGDREQNVQLTLQSNETLGEGDYQLLVVGQSAAVNKSLSLQLSVTRIVRPKAFITANLATPPPVRFGQAVQLIGQLLLPQEPADSRIDQPLLISLVGPEQQVIERQINTDLTRAYRVSDLRFDMIGSWTVTAIWSGDEKYAAVQQSIPVQVSKGMGDLDWLDYPQGVNPDSAVLGTTVNLAAQLSPNLTTSVILNLKKPTALAQQQIRLETDQLGLINYQFLADEEGIWQFSLDWDGNTNYQPSSSSSYQLLVAEEMDKAIIVLGGGSEEVNPNWSRFHTTANHVYHTLLQRRLTDNDIFYLSPSLKADRIVDATTSALQLERAITNWAAARVGTATPLWIYLLSHNIGTDFLLEKQAAAEITLTAKELDYWLQQLPVGTPIYIVIEACYSGSFIPVLAKPGRVIITSTQSDKQAYIWRTSSFSRIFFNHIRSNQSLAAAFEKTEQQMAASQIHSDQNPQFDADGNAVSNQLGDYRALKNIYLPDDLVSLADPPRVFDLTATPNPLSGGLTAAVLSARVPGTQSLQVDGTIIPPDFNPSQQFSNWLELDTFDFKDPDGDRVFVGSYGKFLKQGQYTVLVDASDAEGNVSDTVQIKIAVGQKTSPKLRGDVNGDDRVNIFDLVIAAGSFGKTGAGIMGDVNGDGTVNIFDLVIVAGNFGKSLLAAPSMVAKIELSTEQKHHIASAIDQLESNPSRSTAEEIALNVLQAILPERLPTI